MDLQLTGKQLYELWLKGANESPYIQDYRNNRTTNRWEHLNDTEQLAWNTLAENETIEIKLK